MDLVDTSYIKWYWQYRTSSSLLSFFCQFSAEWLPLGTDKKLFQLHILRKDWWIWMIFHMSNDIDNILLRIITQHFTSIFINYHSCLVTKNRFSFRIMRMNYWIWMKLQILKYFILLMKLFSLVYWTNSICGLGIKCITLLPYQTYQSFTSCFVTAQ